MKKHRVILRLMRAVALLASTLLACAVTLCAGLSVSGAAARGCRAKDGSYLSPAPSNVVGIVSFDVHDCKITNLLLAAVPWSGAWWERNKLLLPSNLGVPQIHISDKIQIRGNQWSFRTEKLGGVFSMNGIFTSPTEAEGSWTLTKGVWFDHQFYFVKQDTSAPWKAHLKKD